MPDWPKVTTKPEPEDVVQVLMTEDMARRFEERCLGVNTVGDTRLSSPLLFREDDVPTYIIETAKESSNEVAESEPASARPQPLYDREVLVTVLVYHARTNTSACHCGWGTAAAQLGMSHPEHVADVYEQSVNGG
jgi:hypothetical protein